MEQVSFIHVKTLSITKHLVTENSFLCEDFHEKKKIFHEAKQKE